jgi:tetratricopeptide (TPR) repeat protein
MADTPRIEELKRRVQSDPASIAFAALAEEYRRAGRFEEAIAACITGLQRHPSYLSAHVTLGRALIEVGRYEDAREELELVLRAAPENLAAIRGLAEIHHRRGDAPDEGTSSDSSQSASAPAVEVSASNAGNPTPHTESPTPAVVPSSPATEVILGAGSWPVDAQASATAPPPELDPVLSGLEAFLSAIERARAGAGADTRR